MRTTRTTLAIALAAALAATPAALAHRSAPPGPPLDKAGGPPASPKPDGPKSRTNYLLWGVVTADATETSVEVRATGGNRHMRDALAGATSVQVGLGEHTRIMVLPPARKGAARAALRPASAHGKRGPHGGSKLRHRLAGTFEDLAPCDRVRVIWRAPRGLAAADLPEAHWIVDFGPKRGRKGAACQPPPPDEPETPPEAPEPEPPAEF